MAKPESGMRQITDPWLMAGPLFQPLRGLVFASVFYPLRGCLFGRNNGWLLMTVRDRDRHFIHVRAGVGID